MAELLSDAGWVTFLCQLCGYEVELGENVTDAWCPHCCSRPKMRPIGIRSKASA